MARLSIRSLGPFQVTLDGLVVEGFHSDKVRALLVYLAMEPDRPHRREALAGLLWPGYPERSARHSLSQALHGLRQVLSQELAGDLLDVTSQAIRWRSDERCQVDAEALLNCADICQQQDPAAANQDDRYASTLEDGIDRYAGPFMEGFSLADSAAFEDWLVAQRDACRNAAIEALAWLAAHHEALGEPGRGLVHAQRWLALDPLDEAAHRWVMRLLAASGQRSTALAHYERCCALLREELGVEPESETEGVYQAILQGQQQSHPRPRHAIASLPMPLLPLVGRDKELADLETLLDDPATRLLTIMGPGGIGKTHLALETARRAQQAFADGVRHVPLEQARTIDDVIMALARAFDLPLGLIQRDSSQQTVRQALANYMRGKTILLLLDAFEGVIEAAPVIGELLAAAPESKALATSRVRLGLMGEQVYRLAGLSWDADDGQADAEALFVLAAQRASADHVPDQQERRAVARICQQVEGMPLALLLAAAWVSAMPVERIADELAAESAEGLDLLAAGPGGDGRHRSMRQVCDLSWRLLDEPMRPLLASLSCFRGGFTAEAAQEVCQVGPMALRYFLDHSLIQRPSAERFAQHALLAHYGAERLIEMGDLGEQVLARHSAYFGRKLAEWDRGMHWPDLPRTMGAVEADMGNVMAAWERAVEEANWDWLDRIGQMPGAYFSCREAFGQFGDLYLTAANKLAAQQDSEKLAPLAHRLLARLLIGAGWGLAFSERIALAQKTLRPVAQHLDRAEAGGEDVRWERVQGFAALCRARPALSRQELMSAGERHWATCRALGDQRLEALLLLSWGWRLGDEKGLELLERAGDLRRQAGDLTGLAGLLPALAVSYASHGQYERASVALAEAISTRDEVGAWSGSNLNDQLIAQARNRLGQFEQAREMLQGVIETGHLYGLHGIIAWAQVHLAVAEMHCGRYAQAEAHARRPIQFGLQHFQPYRVLSLLALAQGHVGQAVGWQRRHCLDLDPQPGQLGYLHWLYILAMAACVTGRSEIARLLWVAADPRPSGNAKILRQALPSGALVAARLGLAELAVETYAAVMCAPDESRSCLWRDIMHPSIDAAAASLPAEVADAARERGRQRDALDMVGELVTQIGMPVDDAMVEAAIDEMMALAEAVS